MKLALIIVAILFVVGTYAVMFGCCVYEVVKSINKKISLYEMEKNNG